MEKYGCGTRCSAVEVSRGIDVPGFGIARAYNMRRIFLNGSKLVCMARAVKVITVI